MQNIKRFLPYIILTIWDFLSVVASVNFTFFLIPVTQEQFGRTQGVTLIQYTFIVFCLLIILNFVAKCYHISSENFSAEEIFRQGLSVFFCAIILFAVNRLLSFEISIEFVIITSVFIFIFMLFSRAMLWFIWKLNKRLHNLGNDSANRVLIFGAGEAGRYLKSRLDNHLQNDMRPVVFIDDDVTLQNKKISGLLVYGGMDKMVEAVAKYNVTTIIVAIPTASRELLEEVLKICRQTKCQMKRFGSLDEIDLTTARLTNINLEELLKRDSVRLNMQAVRQMIEGKTVLVTGGAGSVGSEICRQVLKFDCKELIIFDIHENGLFEIENELRLNMGYQNIIIRLGTIRDSERLNEVFNEFHPQIVFHAAAHKHVPMMELSPSEAIKNNVFGTLNVAKISVQHHAHKFILISTDKAVNPTNIMGASKRVAEMVIQMLDTVNSTDLVAVRFGNVLGSTGSVVPFFQKQIEQGGPVTVTHPEMRRYFMTIPEAVQLVLEAGAMAAGGEIFVLDMGQPVKIYDLACDLIRLSGFEPEVDIKIKFTGLRPGEKLFEEIKLEDENVSNTDNSKIFVLKPINFDRKEFEKSIQELERVLTKDKMDQMFTIIKKLVPTFRHK